MLHCSIVTMCNCSLQCACAVCNGDTVLWCQNPLDCTLCTFQAHFKYNTLHSDSLASAPRIRSQRSTTRPPALITSPSHSWWQACMMAARNEMTMKIKKKTARWIFSSINLGADSRAELGKHKSQVGWIGQKTEKLDRKQKGETKILKLKLKDQKD